MPWEDFTRRGTPASDPPRLTIQKRGTLGLNRAAFEALGEAEHVVLMFDRENHRMGIRPADEDTPHAYPLRKLVKAASYTIAGLAFLHHYEIEHDTALRYESEMQDGILMIDLSQGGVKAGRNGRK